ncbi:unnamed protein product [Penicillium nalgiovense]|nr:unnamed protein product [Penicillium nalgiovense]
MYRHRWWKRTQYFDKISDSVILETRRVDFVPLLQSYTRRLWISSFKRTLSSLTTQTRLLIFRTLLPQRLGMIRTLQLSFLCFNPSWDRCCQILATKLPGLKTLTIRLYPYDLDYWLMPLRPGPQLEESIGRFVDAPFRIELVEGRGFSKEHCYTVTTAT